MARTPFNARLEMSSGTVISSYTVPNGKIAIFAARAITDVASSANVSLSVAGIEVCAFKSGNVPPGMEFKPFTAKGGDVITLSNPGVPTAGLKVGISGLLYDN